MALVTAGGLLVVTGGLPVGATSAASTGVRAAAELPPAIALVGVGPKQYGLVKGLTNGALRATAPRTDSGATLTVATAISPSGTSALLARLNHSMLQLNNFSTDPKPGAALDFTSFAEEGRTTLSAFTEGVAVSDTFGLVTLSEQGVVQLRRTAGQWRIDDRVHSPGDSEAGTPHAPGFIRFPSSVAAGNTFDGVVISAMPLKNGKYLGLASDRYDNTVEVIEGVGTAHPKPVGQLVSPEFGAISGAGEGNGGMAISTETATRAVIATPDGFDVLNLSNPAHPRLLGQTSTTKTTAPFSVAIAPDGDHVVLAANGFVQLYRGLLHAHGPLTFVAAKTLDKSGTYGAAAMAFLSNGTLVVQRSGRAAHDTTAYFLSLITGAEADHLTLTKSVRLAGPAAQSNTLSVTPAPLIATIGPRHLPRGKVGHHYAGKLSVSGGVGHYTFALVSGHLPRGLHRHGAKISGSPKHQGTAHLRIRATNQYGGAVFRTLTLKVRHK